MLRNNKYRKALASDFLCLVLCSFTIFMLLYSNATLPQEVFDGSYAAAAPDTAVGVTPTYAETPGSDDLYEEDGPVVHYFIVDGKAVKA